MIGDTISSFCVLEVTRGTDGEGEGEPCGDFCEVPDRVDETEKGKLVEGEATIMGEVPSKGETAGGGREGGVGSGDGSDTISKFDANKLGEEGVPKPLVTVTITGAAVTLIITVLNIVRVAGDDWASSDDTVSKSAR